MNKIATFPARHHAHELLSGVPLIESPFFEEALAELDWDETTKGTAIHLRENGWAVIDFPDPDIDAIAERIKTSLHSRYDWQGWRTDGWRNNVGLRIQDAYKFNAEVQRIAANPKIISLLSALYGRPAWPFQTLSFPVGTQQHYHSDSLHFSSVPERYMCAVWLALEDIGPGQGPLMYFSGSHKWPIYVNEHMGYCGVGETSEPGQGPLEALWAALVRANGLKPTQFHAKKGQALIWAANLLHGGARQTDPDLTRWSQVTHYYFEDCSYYSPMLSDPFYGRIFFRLHRNIATGQLMPNMYSGRRVPSSFVWPNIARTIRKGDLYHKLLEKFGLRRPR